jgi:hypothetical protein
MRCRKLQQLSILLSKYESCKSQGFSLLVVWYSCCGTVPQFTEGARNVCHRLIVYWKHDLEKLLLAIDQGKKAKADEKAQAKQRVRDEKYTAQRDAALQKKQRTKKNILPQAQPGLYYVDYSIPTRGKTLEGNGLAVTLTEYVPPALGKTLSSQAVLHFEQVLRNIPGYIVTDSRGRMVSLFWKEEVDALVDRLRQEVRARKKE